MRYFKVKTTSHTAKGIGYHLLWSKDMDSARRKMKRMRLPIFEIEEVPMKESELIT
jgi:hypothetical protein